MLRAEPDSCEGSTEQRGERQDGEGDGEVPSLEDWKTEAVVK